MGSGDRLAWTSVPPTTHHDLQVCKEKTQRKWCLYAFICVQPLIFIYGMISLNKYITVACIWRAFPVFSGYMWLYSHSYRGCFHGYTHCSPQLDPQQYQTFTNCQVKPRTYSWVIELASNWFWKSNLSWKNGYMIYYIWYTIYDIHIVHWLNEVTQTYTNC